MVCKGGSVRYLVVYLDGVGWREVVGGYKCVSTMLQQSFCGLIAVIVLVLVLFVRDFVTINAQT